MVSPRSLTIVAAFAALHWLGAVADAHVAPAVKENNRYIKLTVFVDRVRIAYVLYFGEIPGSRLRREIDADGDGVISDDEAAKLAGAWSARLHEAISVTVGGPSRTLAWEASVGLDDRKTSGGAFTIDLVSWACVENDARRLLFRDALAVPDPGETEVLPEESPGTEFTKIASGGGSEPTLTWRGSDGPLADGVRLEWTASPSATVSAKPCVIESDRSFPVKWIVLAAIALALLAAGFLAWRRGRGG